MSEKKLYLVCNAHIDPVWLWNWEEGLAETLSTFRIAAKFCESFEGFVFCHNEALLYQWVEEYDPALFRRIRKLIAAGKWRIIGGWYIQPDCNLLSGESLVRQILAGRSYFRDTFGVEPQTAVNFDPFGHSRGLVQILAKSGYTSYLFCRPGQDHLALPSEDFRWEGFDGSVVLAHRSTEHYNSERGKASAKLDTWLSNNSENDTGIFLWGIGNHGGGPSKEDLISLQEKINTCREWSIRHAGPEEYFDALNQKKEVLPVASCDLNPWAVGCYTSMARVKKMHREFEEALFYTEKMVTHAFLSGLMKYPDIQLGEAVNDLLFCEFHDILPGSGIASVESYARQRMGHGLEILSRLRARAFFSLLAGQQPATDGEFPVMVYNAEPYDIETTLEVELQDAEPNFDPELFLMPELFSENGDPILVQLEKEDSNISNDHRKRLVFTAKLKASSMNRFSCYLRKVSVIDRPMSPVQRDLHFINDQCEIRINSETGLIDQYRVNGTDFLKTDCFKLQVMVDSADPWGMEVSDFRELDGVFRLASVSETSRLAGTAGPLQPIRIIEEGPVRVVVEGLFRFNGSSAVVRYLIPVTGSDLQIDIQVFWAEKDRMLKLAIPVRLQEATCMGQVAYGVSEFMVEGDEQIAQQWVGLFSRKDDLAITIANQTTYGFDHTDGILRLSLLRSPAYAGHPVGKGIPVVRQDRFTPRMDQGEHRFRFTLQAGPARDRLNRIDLESRLLNCPPLALCCYPDKQGKSPLPAIKLTHPAVRLSALKLSENGKLLIIRLYETTGNPARTDLQIPAFGVDSLLILRPFEIKTMAVDLSTAEMYAVNLMES